MPAITSQINNPSHRASFYGRTRMSSSGSTDSGNSSSSSSNSNSTSSNRKKVSSSSNASASTMATSTRTTSSSCSSSPRSKQLAAVAAAASAASKRAQMKSSSSSSSLSLTSSIKIHVEGLKQESGQKSTILDEEEYQTEVIEHMHHMETETTACVELMDAQPELKWFMRPYLVDFIVEIHQTFRLRPETLYLTMNIVDRYVSKRIVYKRHFQLVGCAALLIASKFEDAKDKVPTVSELSQMCCSAYDESAFTQMEGHVLSTIGWVLGFPTPEAWLRITSALHTIDAKIQSVARFFMEASLFHRDFIGVMPSHLAAGSLLLARHICGQVTVPDQDVDVMSAAQSIDTYMMEHVSELSDILLKKYSYSHYAHASTIVKEWYAKNAEESSAQKAAAATGLLPAQSVSAQHLAQHDKAMKQQQQNLQQQQHQQQSQPPNSSFTTPRRGQEDDEEEDVNMQSRCTTPSSMISTPSQMSGDEEEEDDDDEEEEENDMPVTPLSLNSLHDPLVAASSTSNSSDKENTHLHSNKQQPSKNSQSTTFLQVRHPRPALSISQQDNKIIA